MKEVSLKCIEGTSSKFWTIKQTDSQLQVKYGRIGTAGQEKTTDCVSSADALASLDKQVKEKLKKGYELVSETSHDEKGDGGKEKGDGGKVGSEIDFGQTSKTTKKVVESGGSGIATALSTNSAIATVVRDSTPSSSMSQTTAATSSIEHSRAPVIVPIDTNSMMREHRFNPIDLCYAFWRRTEPAPLPQTISCKIDILQDSVLFYHWYDDSIVEAWLRDYKTPRCWSKEECHFWLLGIAHKQMALQQFASGANYPATTGFREFQKNKLKDLISNTTFDGKVSKEQIIELLESVGANTIVSRYRPFEVPSSTPFNEPSYAFIYPILGLLSLADVVEIWQKVWLTHDKPHIPAVVGNHVQSQLISAIRTQILPYIAGEELAQFRSYLASEMERINWTPKASNDQVPLPYIMAGLFGMHDELISLIEEIPDGFYTDEVDYPDLARPQLLVLGLSDPELVLKHWQRLGLRLSTTGESLSWVAHMQWRALGPLYQYIEALAKLSNSTRNVATDKVLHLLLDIKAPEVAPYALRLCSIKEFAQPCRKWLDENRLFAFIGLVKAANEEPTFREEAQKYLRDYVKRVERKSLPIEFQTVYDAIVSETEARRKDLSSASCPQWLEELFIQNAGKKLALPEYLTSAALTPLVLEGYCLDDKQINQILMCIKASAPDKVHPLLVALRAQTDRRQFDAFVWDIFERWLREQAPSKDKWCMLSIGYLASDETVCRLIPLMKDWRAHGNPGRAGFGLDCLRACGSDMALMKIHEISQSASLKSLRSKAQELMILIAQEKGYTTEQFEDRIVPNCGLDSTGNRIFDFGPRQFRFVLGQDLKAFVKDPDGKVKTDLPSPNQSDDPVLAAQAVKDWKSIKSQVKTVAKSQATRLELAMISGRRWTSDEFETLLLKHPLLKIICKTLIWGQFNDDDKLLSTFRFTDEGELADEQEQTFALVREHRVGIVHPLHLSSSQLSKWGEIVSDYGMVPPFSQLGRPSFALSEEESQLDRIDRFAGLLVEAVIIPGTLERCNWLRESVGDGGIFCGHYKYFPGKDLTAFVSYPGIIVGMLTESDKQQFEDIGFYKGRVKVDSWYSRADAARAKLADIDAIVMSEVLGDLTLVMNKAVKA